MFNLLRRYLWIGSFFLLLNVAALQAEEELTFETIVLSGTSIPATPGSFEIIEFLGSVSINSNGQVVFEANLAGAGVDPTNNEALFLGTNDTLELVAREGNVAPGFGGNIEHGTLLPNPFVDNFGNTTFFSKIEGPGVGEENDTALFSDASGASSMILLEGGFVPDTSPGVVFDDFFDVAYADNNQLAVTTRITGAGIDFTNNGAIFVQENDQFTLVAREGAPIEGLSPAASFGQLGRSISMNRFGEYLFYANSTIGPAIFFGVNGSVEPIVVAGDIAPGTISEFFAFAEFSPTINDAGQAAFECIIQANTGAQKQGIFKFDGHEIQLVALAGEDAPGIPLSGNFSLFGTTLLISGTGDTAFYSRLDGLGINLSNDEAVFAEYNGNLNLIVREGSPAPDTLGGVEFDTFSGIAINQNRQLVFKSLLRGTGVNDQNNEALYVVSNGRPNLIARKGFIFDVNDDPNELDLRFIAGISFFSNGAGQDGRPTSLNDKGQIAFALEFTDGTSGVFSATAKFLLGDVNCDGLIDLLDVAPFVDAVSSGTFVAEADINGDGVVDLLDATMFVQLIAQ